MLDLTIGILQSADTMKVKNVSYVLVQKVELRVQLICIIDLILEDLRHNHRVCFEKRHNYTTKQ